MVVYLNNAGQAKLTPEVQAAGIAAVQRPPWEPHDDGEHQSRVRELFGSLIDADATDIAIMPSTAFAITLAARNIQRTVRLASSKRTSGKILLLQDQYNSAVYPWQQIAEESNGAITLEIVPHITPSQEGGWTQAILDRIDENLVAACLPPLHWSNGALIDLEAIGAACRNYNVPLIVDATQGENIHSSYY
jgi:selenocysteine lyase/cysteine desulfurase